MSDSELSPNPDQVAEHLKWLRDVALHGKDRQFDFPTRPPNFEIERELGRGGFGRVYLAKDTRTGRRVALKMPRPDLLHGTDTVARFLKEARTVSKLDHPNIVPLLGIDDSLELPCIIYRYCSGPTLSQWLAARKTPMPSHAAAQLALYLAKAIGHAHDRGVYHRDLKPSNVLLEPMQKDRENAFACEGETWIPSVTDFGISKVIQESQDRSTETVTSGMAGTLDYMSPEQCLGTNHSSPASSDIYALGLILFEMLTLSKPYRASNPTARYLAISTQPPPRPRNGNPHVPRDLDAIVSHCLEVEEEDRYATVQELQDDLQAFLAEEPLLWAASSRWTRASQLARHWIRSPRFPWLVTIAAVGLIVWMVIGTMKAPIASPMGDAKLDVEPSSEIPDRETIDRDTIDRDTTFELSLPEIGPENGGAFYFADAIISLPRDLVHHQPKITFECWLKSDRHRGVSDVLVGTTCSKSIAPRDEFGIHLLDDNVLGLFPFSSDSGTTLRIEWPERFTDSWQHLALTFDTESDEIVAYSNGEFVERLQVPMDRISVNCLVLGQDPDLVGGDYDSSSAFVGMMDEVRIWRCLRTQEEIRSQMHRRLTGDEPYLGGYYPFDDGTARNCSSREGEKANGILGDVEDRNDNPSFEKGAYLVDVDRKGNSRDVRIPPNWITRRGFDSFKSVSPQGDREDGLRKEEADSEMSSLPKVTPYWEHRVPEGKIQSFLVQDDRTTHADVMIALDQGMHQWNVEKKDSVSRLTSPIANIGFALPNQILVTGHSPQTLLCWRVRGAAFQTLWRRECSSEEGEILGMALDRSGTRAAVMYGKGAMTVECIDISTGTVSHAFSLPEGHHSYLESPLEFTSDGTGILISEERALRLVDWRTQEVLAWEVSLGNLIMARYDAEGKDLLVVFRHGVVGRLNLQTGAIETIVQLPSEPLVQGVSSQDRTRWVFIDNRGHGYVLEGSDLFVSREFQLPTRDPRMIKSRNLSLIGPHFYFAVESGTVGHIDCDALPRR